MKKSTTLFTLALFAILAFSSCEREQWGNAQKGSDDIDNRAEGQIGLSALKVSVDEKTTSTVTRTGINTDNFIIRIYDMDKEGKMVQEWKYSEMPEIFTLKVSHYSITAMSHEVQPAEFETGAISSGYFSMMRLKTSISSSAVTSGSAPGVLSPRLTKAAKHCSI